jgi:hypothetical protein
MFALVYVMCKLIFKLFVWMTLLSVWLTVAMIVLPVAVVASATGHERTARQWQRSLKWRRRF